ncbi:hypothetical protein V8E36_000268 [Tilletia maclaganii]
MSTSTEPVEAYERQDAIGRGMNGALQAAAAGVLFSSVQNALQKHNAGALGIFTRTGSTIGIFTAMGGAFAFTEPTVANIREKEDPLNAAAGGCAAGLIMGVSARSPQTMIFGCLGLGALMGTFQATGRSLIGSQLGQPTNAIPVPVAEGEEGHTLSAGRALRERRRQAFFKQPRADAESEQ